MASWQPYVDSLTNSGKVSKAAIHGHDGSLYATSPGFNVSQEEFKQIYAGFSDSASLQSNGLYVAGKKYFLLRADDASIYGKSDAVGVVCCNTKQTVIIAYYEGGVQAQESTAVVEKLADYLRSLGY